MPLRHFYLSVPSADGLFIKNRASEDFEEGISIYEFECLKNDPNKASFWLAKKAIEFALENIDRRIQPVCDSVNNLDKNIHHHVETIKPGIAKLLPNGNWKMETKAEIKYVELDEQKKQEELQKTEELRKQLEETKVEKEREKAEKEREKAEKEQKDRELKQMQAELAEKNRKIAEKDREIEKEREKAAREAKIKEMAMSVVKKIQVEQPQVPTPTLPIAKPDEPKKSSQGGCGKKFGCMVFILIALGILGVLTKKIDIEQLDIFNYNDLSLNWYTANPAATNFTISTAKELAGLAQIVNGTCDKKIKRNNFAGKTITLARDIDLSQNNNWEPIGNYSAGRSNVFSGTFNGNGYVIKNLKINRPDINFQGLFGFVSGGKIQKLRLDNVNIIGRDSVGSVAGFISEGSSIINSYSVGAIKGMGMVGGLAGGIIGNSSIANSYSAGVINGDEGVGGLTGTVRDNSSITYSYSTAAVRGRTVIGGLSGALADNSNIANCAALNSEVKGGASGRVFSNAWNGFKVSNNVAYNAMLNNAGKAEWNRKGAAARDGADITIATIKRDGTIGGRFTAKNGWKIQNGNLPELYFTIL